MVQERGGKVTGHMLKHCYPSIARPSCNVARIRTNARTQLTQSMAESRGNLTFRNARAHIRRFSSADFASEP
jgi:hypothetical protein